jgi:Rrf2 family cysteine metabolism transcriptional repressor
VKLSTRGEYGLRAMLYLAMETGAYVHAQTISEAQGIPTHYLKQILIQLRATGLIRSARGPNGGHSLSRSADDISVGGIVRCLEGQLTGVESILDMPCSIQVGPKHCVIKELLLTVKAQVENLLDNTSLSDMAERQRTIVASGHVVGAPVLIQTDLMRLGQRNGGE